jgi:hemerythrin-like domain-containing protein
MIIELLSKEHQNLKRLLDILEHEFEVLGRGKRPDYEVVRAIISYFEVYPEQFHHPQEDLVLAKLKSRDPAAAAKIGDLDREHTLGTERLRRVAQALDAILADREMLREDLNTIIRDFIDRERRHIFMEDKYFFPVALEALKPEDWAEIDSTLTNRKDPLFSDAVEERFEMLREHILQLEKEAEAERR